MRTVKQFYENFNFEHMITQPPPLIQEFLEREIDFLKRHITPTNRILEVGCGYGRLLDILRTKAATVAGIDFSRPMLDKSRARFQGKSVELYEMRAEQMGFLDGRFDYAMCLGATFGNMPGIEQQVLREMVRVTRPRGKVMVSVFSEEAKDSQILNYGRLGLKRITDDGAAIRTDEGFYSRRFTRDSLIELFGNAGLEPTITKLCPINYVVCATTS